MSIDDLVITSFQYLVITASSTLLFIYLSAHAKSHLFIKSDIILAPQSGSFGRLFITFKYHIALSRFFGSVILNHLNDSQASCAVMPHFIASFAYSITLAFSLSLHLSC